MKRMKFRFSTLSIIAFLFIFTTPGYSLWNYQELRKAVVQIYRPDANAGTGFIVQRGDKIFLVTNAHMLQGVEHISVVAYLSKEGKPEAGKTKFEIQLLDNNKQPLWKTKPGVDLSVVLLPETVAFTVETSRTTILNSVQPSIGKFDYSQLASDSIITLENIEPGNLVRALGYPNALSYGEFENYPVLIAGYLSTDIINDTINSPKLGKIKNTFIVNFFGSKGSSGSPVLSSNEDRIFTQPKTYISIKIGSPTYILGVIYSGPIGDDPYGYLPVFIRSSTGQSNLYTPPEDTTAHLTVPLLAPNIGLTYVIPAKYVRGLIDLFP